MPGLLHQAHQDDIKRKVRESIGGGVKKKCKNCGEIRTVTNEGLCYDYLYLDSHYGLDKKEMKK